MDQAIYAAGARLLAEAGEHHPGTLVRAYPLSDTLLAVVHVWQAPGQANYTLAAKGAPEAVADLCHLDTADRERLAGQVAGMAADGLRVLGVARAATDDAGFPNDPRAFSFALLGLLGLADPIRPEVPAAVSECYRAGVRVVMLTGDYPLTAQTLAARSVCARSIRC